MTEAEALALHSLSPLDLLAHHCEIDLDGVRQAPGTVTYASEHAGYIARLVKTPDGKLIPSANGKQALEEIVAGDVRITFPGLTPEQIADYEYFWRGDSDGRELVLLPRATE